MTAQKVAAIQDGIYLFPEFLPDVQFFFSTREFDASRDIPFFLEAIGVRRDRFATVEQVHGDRVIRVSNSNFSEVPEADAMVTIEKDLALVIRSADCVPLFLYNSEISAAGICHAGWRGIRQEIVSKTLEEFRQSFGSEPERVQAAIGPAICKDCYEVGEEFEDYFPGFVKRKQSRFFFNLKGAVEDQLLRGGIPTYSIREAPFCTSCSVDQFFSARREGIQTGRLISAVVLK